ncbi:undecaprenyl-diphosphatase [Halalkalibacterium ligniniphilum]|uniref:undecaprenyl-diphosphatase n=1 Tax=Halalkalibacterium ligniniphilum TaxID=1134413 RepID=UPI0003477709|nr:undecaprenyl-diphosphatase [Halalkalibacterium ligniniphilum]
MDENLFKAIRWLAGRYSPLDIFMIFVSNKVRYLFFFVLIVMWFRNYKKMTLKAVLSVLISLCIQCLIKMLYFKPRPFVKHRVGILMPSKMDSSFPSKHTLLMFAISTSIFLRERILGSIMGGLSLLTGLSRVWVGHHYPSDIIGSAIIGSLISMIAEKLTFRTKTTPSVH